MQQRVRQSASAVDSRTNRSSASTILQFLFFLFLEVVSKIHPCIFLPFRQKPPLLFIRARWRQSHFEGSLQNAEPTFMVGEVQSASSALPETSLYGNGRSAEDTFTVSEVQNASSILPHKWLRCLLSRRLAIWRKLLSLPLR